MSSTCSQIRHSQFTMITMYLKHWVFTIVHLTTSGNWYRKPFRTTWLTSSTLRIPKRDHSSVMKRHWKNSEYRIQTTIMLWLWKERIWYMPTNNSSNNYNRQPIIKGFRITIFHRIPTLVSPRVEGTVIMVSQTLFPTITLLLTLLLRWWNLVVEESKIARWLKPIFKVTLLREEGTSLISHPLSNPLRVNLTLIMHSLIINHLVNLTITLNSSSNNLLWLVQITSWMVSKMPYILILWV